MPRPGPGQALGASPDRRIQPRPLPTAAQRSRRPLRRGEDRGDGGPRPIRQGQPGPEIDGARGAVAEGGRASGGIRAAGSRDMQGIISLCRANRFGSRAEVRLPDVRRHAPPKAGDGRRGSFRSLAAANRRLSQRPKFRASAELRASIAEDWKSPLSWDCRVHDRRTRHAMAAHCPGRFGNTSGQMAGPHRHRNGPTVSSRFPSE